MSRRSHGTHVTKLLYVIKSCTAHLLYIVTSHISMSHVAYMTESRHAGVMAPHVSKLLYVRKSCTAHVLYIVISHIWMSHVAHINGSWHTCIKDANESVSLAPHNATVLCCKYESCRTFEGVMSHVWKSHIAQLNEYMCAHVSTMQYTLNDAIHSWVLRCISHNWKSHIAQLNESWHTYIHDAIHS